MEEKFNANKYIILDENMIYHGIKYEIGNTYHIPHKDQETQNKHFLPKIINDFEMLNRNVTDYLFHQNKKLIEIKIKKDLSNADLTIKLTKECNYAELHKLRLSLSGDVCLNETILAAKLNDKKSLDKILNLYFENKFTSYYGMILVKTNIEEYIEKLLNSNSIFMWQNIAKFVNRNKYFNRLIAKEDKGTIATIIDKGINKYLDFYMKNEFQDNIVFRKILRQGRFKDINCFLKSKSKNIYPLLESMISTGIDRYLDYAIISKDSCLYDSIIQIGRKKDIDFLLKEKVKSIDDFLVVKRGFEEHLDIISKTSKDKEILNEILKYNRECDLWLKEKLELERDE